MNPYFDIAKIAWNLHKGDVTSNNILSLLQTGVRSNIQATVDEYSYKLENDLPPIKRPYEIIKNNHVNYISIIDRADSNEINQILQQYNQNFQNFYY